MKKVLFLIVLAFVSCSKKEETKPLETRSFYMGTTPWPADLTVTEVNNTYDFINNNCDIVSHHFDEGVPYNEAFNNLTMPNSLLDNVQTRKLKTNPNKKIFLSVSALNIDRISKASYYNNATTANNIKTYWEQLPFDDPKIVTAYVNYLSWLIDEFHPIYVNYGVESNAGQWNAIDFLKYKTFLSQTYNQLKIKYSTIPFFISFIVTESNLEYNNATQLTNYTDFIGLSAYPYIGISSSANEDTNPNNFPANYFEKFINLANKPLAFAETGYIAQNLSIPAYSLNKQGNEIYQRDYLEKVLQLCNEKNAKLFIWFCPKDYDNLIITFQNQGLGNANTLNLLALWRDTGLIDETGRQRLSSKSWTNWMEKEKK
jgi:hypothetical protein